MSPWDPFSLNHHILYVKKKIVIKLRILWKEFSLVASKCNHVSLQEDNTNLES